MLSWFIRPLIQAFSIYSRMPMPQTKWEDNGDGRILIYFPLVGALIGALMDLSIYVCGILKVPVTAAALIVISIPIIVTGGIHIDGFMDTADARHSFKSREEKIAIMSDPHVGAFGVIRLVLFMMVSLAAMIVILQQANSSILIMMVFAMTFSRTLSGWTSVAWQGAKKDGMLRSVTGKDDDEPKSKKTVTLILLIEVLAVSLAMIVTDPVMGICVVTAGVVMSVIYRFIAYREFGGVTGDLAGWFLCMSELLSAVTAAICMLVGDLI